MKLRQVIQNLSFEGDLTNTSVVEFDGPDKNLPPRNATPEDLALIGDATGAGYLSRIAELEAEVSTLDDLRQERDAARATLVEHQAHADELVRAARVALAAGDHVAIQQILHAASLFGTAREKDRLDTKAAELQAQLDAIAAAQAAL